MEVYGWLVAITSIIVTKTDRALHIRRADSTLFQEQQVFLFCLSATGSLQVTKGTPPRRETSRADGILRLIANEAFYHQVLTRQDKYCFKSYKKKLQ